MINELETELKTHLGLKLLTMFVLVFLFLGSVQVVKHEINTNSDIFQNKAEVRADSLKIQAFGSYYQDANRTDQEDKLMNQVLRQVTNNSGEGLESEGVVRLAVETAQTLSFIDPFYPRPCVGSSDNCQWYLDKESVKHMNYTLQTAQSSENLREFAEEHKLDASEDFYRNYSDNESLSSNTGSNVRTALNFYNSRYLNAKTYAINIIYLMALGFFIATLISAPYRLISRYTG